MTSLLDWRCGGRRQTLFQDLCSILVLASEALRNLAVREHLTGQVGEMIAQTCGQVVLSDEVYANSTSALAVTSAESASIVINGGSTGGQDPTS